MSASTSANGLPRGEPLSERRVVRPSVQEPGQRVAVGEHREAHGKAPLVLGELADQRADADVARAAGGRRRPSLPPARHRREPRIVLEHVDRARGKPRGGADERRGRERDERDRQEEEVVDPEVDERREGDRDEGEKKQSERSGEELTGGGSGPGASDLASPNSRRGDPQKGVTAPESACVAALSPRAAGCAPSVPRPSWRRPAPRRAPPAQPTGVAVEDDEVGEVSRQELAAPVPVAGETGRIHRRGSQRLLGRQSLVHPPAGPLVEGAKHAGADPDAAGRAPRSGRRSRWRRERSGLARASGRRRRPALPGQARSARSRSERSMAELDGAGDAEGGEAREIGWIDQLGVLDARRRQRDAKRSRVASNASSASRFARSPMACTATGQPAAEASRIDLGELCAGRDGDARAVEHPGRPRAERTVHEHLQVAQPQEVVTEA